MWLFWDLPIVGAAAFIRKFQGSLYNVIQKIGSIGTEENIFFQLINRRKTLILCISKVKLLCYYSTKKYKLS